MVFAVTAAYRVVRFSHTGDDVRMSHGRRPPARSVVVLADVVALFGRKSRIGIEFFLEFWLVERPLKESMPAKIGIGHSSPALKR